MKKKITNKVAQDKLQIALSKKPVTLDDLCNLLGGGKASKRLIINRVNSGDIKLEEVDFTVNQLSFITILLLFSNLLLLNLNGFLRGLYSLFVLFFIPIVWNSKLLRMWGYDVKLSVVLSITELMVLGMILGYFDILFPIYITGGLAVFFMIKYIYIDFIFKKI